MSNADWVDDDDWVDDQPQKNKFSAGQAAVMHGLQGLAGGFMDEIQGAGEAAGRVFGIKGAGGPMRDMGRSEGGPTLDLKTLSEAYKTARDRERNSLKTQSEEHPGVAGAAGIAGLIASPINKVARGLSLAKGGAVLGGINALGASDAEDIKGLAKDTGVGTAGGLLLGKGVEKAAPIVGGITSKTASTLRDLAERFAARALGAERGTIKKLGFDKIKGAAGQMLDEGGLTPFGSTDDMIVKNEALKTKGGKMMGQAYKAIDDANQSNFNPLEVAAKVDDKLGGFYRSPINRGETNQLENTLESIMMRGDGNIPLREAQTLKEELKKVANWKNNLNVTDKEKMAREAYGIVSSAIDDSVAKGSQAIESAGLSKTLAKGKDLYSKASTAEGLLDNRRAREEGNRFIGITDAIAGTGAVGYGGATGDWETAGGLLVAKKGLQKYGSQNAALGLDKVSKALMKSPQMTELAKKSPPLFNALVRNITQSIEQSPKAADKSKVKDKTSNLDTE